MKLTKRITKKIKQNTGKRINYFEKPKKVSYLQYSKFIKCPHLWKLSYIDKQSTFESTIHLVFGTAMHETIQEFLDTCYNKTVKQADQLDLELLLQQNMYKQYSKQVKTANGEHFSTAAELAGFWRQGCAILKYFKRKRSLYFTTKKVELLGIEIPINIQTDTNPYVNFTGYVDLVLHEKSTDTIRLVDIKTSTKGWNKYKKKDHIARDQLILYKHYFSKHYEVPIDQIKVDFFIVKRELHEDVDFPQKRIQEFIPSQKKVTVNKTTKRFNYFIDSVFKHNSDQYNKAFEYPAITGDRQRNCTFCEFAESELCPTQKRLVQFKPISKMF